MLPYVEIGNEIFKIIIPSYALFGCIGLFCMMLMIYNRSQNMNIPFDKLLVLFLCLVIGAAVGSKALFFMTRIPNIIADFSFKKLLNEFLTGGFVFYGGVFGAISGTSIYARIFGYKKNQMFDLVAPAFPLFHFWGRIGCFFAGCCYGKVADWGIALKREPGILRLPVQLFEAVFLLLIVIVLLRIEKKNYNTNLMKAYLCLYALGRFILEFFRGDEIRGIWLEFSTSQWISFIMEIWIVVDLIGQYLKERICSLKGEKNESV